MAIAQASRVTGGTSATNTTIISPAQSHTAGRLLIAGVIWPNTGSISSIADVAGNTWLLAGSEYNAGGNKHRLYYAANCLGSAVNVVTVTLGTTQTYRTIVVTEWTGIRTTNPWSATNAFSTGNNPSGTTVQTDAALGINSSEEVVYAIGSFHNGTHVAGSGYTLTNWAVTGDAGTYFADEYRVITAPSTPSVSTVEADSGIIAASFMAPSTSWGQLLGGAVNRLVIPG